MGYCIAFCLTFGGSLFLLKSNLSLSKDVWVYSFWGLVFVAPALALASAVVTATNRMKLTRRQILIGLFPGIVLVSLMAWQWFTHQG